MSIIKYWIFDHIVLLILKTQWGKYIHNAAWHDGWEQRAIINGPACPSDHYPGPVLNEEWV